METPTDGTIRLYSKVRRSLQNMLDDQESAILWPGLFSRLSAVKVDLELCYPGIAKIAPDDPRMLEVDVIEEESKEGSVS